LGRVEQNILHLRSLEKGGACGHLHSPGTFSSMNFLIELVYYQKNIELV